MKTINEMKRALLDNRTALLKAWSLIAKDRLSPAKKAELETFRARVKESDPAWYSEYMAGPSAAATDGEEAFG